MGFKVTDEKKPGWKARHADQTYHPGFLYDYFFFFFAAFFFAAMFITSDRSMEFHSAIPADGVIYLTDCLYEEMRGAGNDYFNDLFPVTRNCDGWAPRKSSPARQTAAPFARWFSSIIP